VKSLVSHRFLFGQTPERAQAFKINRVLRGTRCILGLDLTPPVMFRPVCDIEINAEFV